ncbi:anti-sigma factor domain-containing protein [Oscillospiraceae bacterium PP1C4]
MKSVIVEIKGEFAAALSDDGCIVKVKNNNYAIGQVIEMKKQVVAKTRNLAVWTASAAAIIMVGSVSAWAYMSPYSYVSLDVNPSIEYSLNRFDRVIAVKAVNDDGEEILGEIQLDNLSNQKIEQALAQTVELISEKGYFDGNIEGGVMIATSGKDLKKADDLAQKLQQSVQKDVEENGDAVEVEAISVGLERVQQAKELGVTPGKLNLVEKLKASAPDPDSIDINEWLNAPVKEIMKATKEYKQEQKEEKKAEKKSSKNDDNTSSSSSEQESSSSAQESSSSSQESSLNSAAVEQKAKANDQSVKETAQKNPVKDVLSKAQSKADDADKAASKIEKDEEKTSIKEEKAQSKIDKKESVKEEKTETSENKSNGNNKK